MLKTILKMAAGQYLARRHARTGTGPRRMPPTSMDEARNRMAADLVRRLFDRFGRR